MKKELIFVFFIFTLSLVSSQSCPTGSTDSISQYGITWTFDNCYTYGTFVNGDYWVLGPLTITSITPDAAQGRNGWEVNPTKFDRQPYDDRSVIQYDSSLMPSLPYQAKAGDSIIKTVSVSATSCSTPGQQQCLQTAAVLTVLGSVPPDNGATVFRPSYIGTTKTLYSSNNLRTDLLPSLPKISNTPNIDDLTLKIKRVQLDHPIGWGGRSTHPVDNMKGYGAELATDYGEMLLRLTLDDPISEKRKLLIPLVQAGIDIFGKIKLGGGYSADGGHSLGRKGLLAFTAVMLNDDSLKSLIKNADKSKTNSFYHEDGSVYYSSTANNGKGIVLWGQNSWDGSNEKPYWDYVASPGGATRDPYELIDGNYIPGEGYQFCCNSQPYKGHALIQYLMPEVKEVYNSPYFLDYVDRWVTYGAWAQPDSCAPYTGNTLDYGLKYGPDGKGSCIKDLDSSNGIGRFPNYQGTNENGGYYGSSFVNDMWAYYRGTITNSNIPSITPKNFKAKALSSSSIELSWSDVGNEQNYIIERSKSNTQNFQTISTSPKDSYSFIDSSLEPNTAYYYRIKSTNNIYDSKYSSIVSASTSQSLDSNLNLPSSVSYISFDGSVNDYITGAENSYNNVLFIDGGKKYKAARFFGQDSYSSVTLDESDFILSSGDFSISIWFNSLGNPEFNNGRIIQSDNEIFEVSFTSPSWQNWVIRASLAHESSSAQATSQNLFGPITLGTAGWQHLVITYDSQAKKIKLYLNGVESQYQSNINGQGNRISFTSKRFFVGSNMYQKGVFNGDIDELRIFNKILTQPEISLLFDDTYSLCPDGLISGLEECDDGNNINGDGCSSNCIYERISLSQDSSPSQGSGSGGGGGGGGGGNNNNGNTNLQTNQANQEDLVIKEPSTLGKNEVIEQIAPGINDEENNLTGFEYILGAYVALASTLLITGVVLTVKYFHDKKRRKKFEKEKEYSRQRVSDYNTINLR